MNANGKASRWRVTAIAVGLGFLYLPLLAVVIYSFNASRLVTVWAGFSLRWYGELFADDQILAAAGVSLMAATLSATLATIIGTTAGFALARFGPFRGRALFAGTVTAPLVMPDIISGLSLLLLFVALEQALPWMPGRGLATIVMAHATLGLSYVAVVVQARVVGQDRAIEDAAADLGARPATVFRRVTLPLMVPAVAAGWLLAFVLSFDDLVIASFVAGPQSTTLPMVVFSSIRLGVSPKINALATLLLLATGLMLTAAGILARRALPKPNAATAQAR
ncbi:MAG: ABC transporter permease subunit [Rhodospirillaceae bacterium]|nr:MAG: ABC transporter permease subunit [Rhodospirillaceae bacterium]